MNSALQLEPNNFHELSIDKRRVMFHIPTTALFELDEISGSLIDFFAGQPQVKVADLQARFDQQFAGADIMETLHGLQQLDIVSDGSQSRELKHQVDASQFPLGTIVLNVNTGCNLSCTYCYKEDLTTPAKGDKMSFDIAKASVDLLFQQSPEEEQYNVVFFGGEPLTNMPLIKQVIAYTSEKAYREKKRVDFSLTTNATMLNEDNIAYFNKHRVGITVSMDGPQAIHDKNRITVGGQGTYAVVAKKVKLLLDNYNARPVGVRVTLTKGVTDVEAIWEHLYHELGFAEVGFAPVTAGDVAYYNLTNDELLEIFSGFKRLGKKYLDAALRNENTGFGNLHQLMSNLHQGVRRGLPCGAGVSMMAVDKEGDLNLCHRFTGSDMPTFGNVNEGVNHQQLGEFVAARADRTGTGCASCRIRNLCSGGCYHESYAQYGDPTHPVYHYCDLMRDWIDFGIETYSRISQQNPDFFATHVTPRRAANPGE